MANNIPSVIFFYRKPLPFHKSIEFIFDDVRKRLPDDFLPVKKVAGWYSKGIVDRIRIILEAKRNQGDINHVTGDIHFAAILLEKKKTLLTVHDCGMLADSRGLKHFLLKFFWFTLPLRRCAMVTVVSEATKKTLLQYSRYPAEQVHVIPVAVSDKFVFSPKSFNVAKPVILQVGTTPNKNLERLIEAIKDLRCELRIIGKLTDALRRQLQETGIEYVNRFDLTQDELVEEYVQADMLSFASTYEGFGMPIVEANAVGRPVVTSNILSMPEVAAGAACLVDPFDVQSIRDGIVSVIEDADYRDQLIQNGLKNCKRFDPQRIANSYAELYKKIWNENKAGKKSS